MFYYLRLAGLAREAAIDLIQATRSTARGKASLLKRLVEGETLYLPPPTGSKASSESKRAMLERLRAHEDLTELQGDQARHAMEAIRMLAADSLEASYVLPLLRAWFDRFYGSPTAHLTHPLRRAICYADEALNPV